MSRQHPRQHDPFEDDDEELGIGSTQQQQDPFQDADSPQLFSSESNPYGQAGSSSKDTKHGYALDPFFDEYVPNHDPADI